MPITADQAQHADEFHVAHSGLPCTTWRRSGTTFYSAPDDSWMIFAIDPETGNGYYLTDLRAGDWHVPGDCPRREREARPASGHTMPLPGPDDGYDEDGYDADGYDRDGYGYDDRDRDGNARPGSLDAADLDLAELWSAFAFCAYSTSARQDEFRQYLRTLVRDPGEIDDLKFCDNCYDPAWDDDLCSAQGGSSQVCDSCWDDWSDCASCEERYPDDDLYETLSGSDICESCRDSYYTYCEDCGGYYNDNDADEHEHDEDDSGCCESPQMQFTVRNDGCPPLANDTRATVTLPAGVISGEGLYAIRMFLRGYDLYLHSGDLDKLGSQWQTRAGNFTKRLSRHAYQSYQVKLPPEALSRIGCITRDHSTAVSTEIEVTRDLNLSAGEFYHDGSCWWNSFRESRCALKTNGGFGLRSFSGYEVSGRAWVMPLRQDEHGNLHPTFDTMTPDAFAVFNGYGDLSGYAPARIVAHMAGWTYRKINFECSPMYVNPGGYIVAPEEIAAKYTDGSLHLDVPQHARLFGIEQDARKELVNA